MTHGLPVLKVGTRKSGQERLSSTLKRVRVRLRKACVFRGQLAHTQMIWTHHKLLQLFKLKRM